MVSVAAVLLSSALWIGAGPTVVRARAGLTAGSRRRPQTSRMPSVGGSDPLAIASSLDVLAVCLGAGMAVSSAAAATAVWAPPKLGAVLRRAADLLALGADPDTAWSTPPDLRAGSVDSQIDSFLRLARRSASSGAALAERVAELADQTRHDATHAAAAAAGRAGVLIAGPLGLCFLPAFVCLGLVPVVAGLAGDVLRSGLL
jgi:pilus assembly protein TadC